MKYFFICLDLPWHLSSEFCGFLFIDPIHIQLDLYLLHLLECHCEWHITFFWTLLVHSWYIGKQLTSILTLYSVTLLYLLISSKNILLIPWDFLPIQSCHLWTKVVCLFLPNLCTFYSFLALLHYRNYSMIMNRISEIGQPCFVPDLGEESI